MNENEQWARAIEIANEAIADVDFMRVSEMLEDDTDDDGVLDGVYNKVTHLRAHGDRHHSMEEMYKYRLLYNAALFNAWALSGQVRVCKSWNHSDRSPALGGGWFIVVAELPQGQISNHYAGKFWETFKIPEVEFPPEYDGHTPDIAALRLERFLANDYRIVEVP